MDRVFPLMVSPEERRILAENGHQDVLRGVPWGLVERARQQAESNHGGQTLERMAERGGLSSAELVAVLEGWAWADPRAAAIVADPVRAYMTIRARAFAYELL